MARLAVILAVLFAAPAAAEDTTVPTSLAEIARGERPCSDLMARYYEGGRAEGAVQVEIEAGRVVVRRLGVKERPGARREAGLTTDECYRLARTAAASGIEKVRPTRSRARDGEARPEIMVGVAGKGRVVVRMPESAARRSRAFQALRTMLLSVAARVTAGEVRP